MAWNPQLLGLGAGLHTLHAATMESLGADPGSNSVDGAGAVPRQRVSQPGELKRTEVLARRTAHCARARLANRCCCAQPQAAARS